MCLGAIGIVVEVGRTGGMPYAVVDFGDRTADVGVLDPEGLRPGGHVLVHSGFILEVLDDERAAEMLTLRDQMVGPLAPLAVRAHPSPRPRSPPPTGATRPPPGE